MGVEVWVEDNIVPPSSEVIWMVIAKPCDKADKFEFLPISVECQLA